MFDTKLIHILRKLDAKEVKKLYEFVDSPFFFKSEKGEMLLRYLKPYFPQLDAINLEKEAVFAHLYPNKAFNNLRFNRICFDAVETVESFLRHYYLEETDAYINKPVFEFYQKHHFDKYFDTMIKALESLYEKELPPNDLYLFQKWLLNAANYRQKSMLNQRESMQFFEDMANSLDDFYLTKKLELINVNSALQTLFLKKGSLFLEKGILNIIEEQSIAVFKPITQLYYSLNLLQKEKDIAHFEQVDGLLKQYKDILSVEEKRNFYTTLQNFCIQQINKHDDENFRKKLFELYKICLDENLLADSHGNIFPPNFKNIVRLALGLQEYTWTASFIEKYAEKLPEERRTDVENDALAQMAFSTGYYQKVLQILQTTEPVDIFFKIDAKRLLIRTYYELGEIELALSSLNTFRVFIHRDNIIHETHKLSNRNFINILNALIQANSFAKLLKIKKELLETPQVAEKKWLTLKIEAACMVYQKK